MRRVSAFPLAMLACMLAASDALVSSNKIYNVRSPPPLASSKILRHHLRAFTSLSSIGSNISISSASSFDALENNGARATKLHLSLALETTIRFILKYLIFRQVSSLAVKVDASSNRALLQGKVNDLSVSARDCIFRFNLLSLKRWDVAGVNLRLGYFPLLLPCLPWVVWRLRRCIWLAIVGAQIMKIAGYIEAGSLGQIVRSGRKRIFYLLGARSSTLNYSLSIAKDDVARSAVLRFWLQGVLRSLVENSVVGAAAAVGDAFDAERKSRENQVPQIRVPLLPSSRNGNIGTDLQNVLAPSSSDSGPQSQTQGLTSALLSATSFKLKDASLLKGRVILQAEAEMPKEKSNTGGIQTFPFTIRAKLAPTFLPEGEGESQQQDQPRQKANAIGFLSPECRMNTNPLTAGTLLGKFIPDVVWIPFGVGVAVPLGRGHKIHRADISDGRDDALVCRFDGSLDFFRGDVAANTT